MATETTAPTNLEHSRRVPLSVLVRGDNPRRKKPAPDYIQQIADSMRKHDVIEPLITRPAPKGGDQLQIVCGETRFEAATLAGLTTVPVVIRAYSDLDVLEVQLIENIQRNAMHPIDEGEAFKRLIDTKKHTVESLAKTLGKSVRWIYNRLEFTKLISPLRDAFLKDEITVSHAELLARLEPADQVRIDNRPSDQGGFLSDEGLWRWDYDDEGQGKHRSAVSLRDLNRWIERNVRLAIGTPAVQNLLPEIEEVQMAAARENARILQVATAHILPAGAELKKRFEGVLTEHHWKRAGGKFTCDHAERAVIVFGAGQGDIVDVCVNKKGCAKHWPEHQPKVAEQRKAQRGKDADVQETARQQHERDVSAQRAKEERWAKLAPALIAAGDRAVKKIARVSPGLLGVALKRLDLPVVKPAQVTLALVAAAHQQTVDRSRWYEREGDLAAWLRLLGVDVKAVERQVLQPEKATAARDVLKKNARPGVRKALAKRKAAKKR